MNNLVSLFVEENIKVISNGITDTEFLLKSPFNIIIPVFTIICILVFGLNIINNKNKKQKAIISIILLILIIFMLYLLIITSGLMTIRTESIT